MIDNVLLPFLYQEQTSDYLYTLVDSALIEGFYSSLQQIDKLRYKSLLAGTPDESAAEVGPVLLELKPEIHSAFIQTLLKYQTEYQTPIWLQTPIPFTQLFNTLRKLLYVEKEDGSQHFFRYYDQLCFPGFLEIANKNPYYVDTMSNIQWAIWQQKENKYHYYNRD